MDDIKFKILKDQIQFLMEQLTKLQDVYRQETGHYYVPEIRLNNVGDVTKSTHLSTSE